MAKALVLQDARFPRALRERRGNAKIVVAE